MNTKSLETLQKGQCVEIISNLCEYYEYQRILKKILEKYPHKRKKEAFLIYLQVASSLLTEYIEEKQLLLESIRKKNENQKSIDKTDSQRKIDVFKKFKKMFLSIKNDENIIKGGFKKMFLTLFFCLEKLREELTTSSRQIPF